MPAVTATVDATPVRVDVTIFENDTTVILFRFFNPDRERMDLGPWPGLQARLRVGAGAPSDLVTVPQAATDQDGVDLGDGFDSVLAVTFPEQDPLAVLVWDLADSAADLRWFRGAVLVERDAFG